MGIGVDIVELSRLDIENERFVRHILSDAEYEIFQSFPTKKRKREYLGGRFAPRKLI
ncbi:4'-phosphopantetheinyl transferase superfamily protein [Catenibacterium sp. co_0103]|uniref:4'-phosphopantetheinyl transferase superfamily protein n=1 Tax=Catenibacterium sp. co_0103 TaxID=2478954 RepID=UPI0024794392|nr:4'-phosphopantetheinyl transferase superfamily protein [Catenibacterium sp. co_0103]